MLSVSINSNLYLCTLKIKASFSSYIDDSSASVELILKKFKEKKKQQTQCLVIFLYIIATKDQGYSFWGNNIILHNCYTNTHILKTEGC